MGFLNKIFGNGNKSEGQGMAAQVMSQLVSDLNLSSDQVNQVKAAFQKFREVRKDLKAKGGDSMKEQMIAPKQELKTTILSILSEEQKQKFMANIGKYREFFNQ